MLQIPRLFIFLGAAFAGIATAFAAPPPGVAPPEVSPSSAPSPAAGMGEFSPWTSPPPKPSPTPAPALVAAPSPSPAPALVAAPSPSPAPALVAKPSAPSPDVNFEIDHIDDGTIYFRSDTGHTPKPLKTDLSEAEYIGTIHSPDTGIPYFLLSAKPCRNCSDEKQIVILRADNGYLSGFEYPGKVIDPHTGYVVLDSRAFYGKCLRKGGEAYVVFQRERVERRHRAVSQSSVFVAEADEDHPYEHLIERHLPRVTDALHYVKRKLCHEISGHDRRMPSHPLDVNVRRGTDLEDSDTDDDDSTKENQTDDDLARPVTE